MTYLLEDHACRYCGGRVLSSEKTYTCANCGHTENGDIKALCACGIKIKGRSLYKCAKNNNPTASNPSVIVMEVRQ